MNKKDKQAIYRVLAPFLADPHVQKMKDYIQHGNITTYRHVVNVAKLTYILNKKLHLNADLEVALPAALLHDFYLYDWHDRPNFDLHGLRHPARAVRNAAVVFDMDEEVLAAIRTHMWPLTPYPVPKGKEAWLICMADKLASMLETLWMRGEPDKPATSDE